MSSITAAGLKEIADKLAENCRDITRLYKSMQKKKIAEITASTAMVNRGIKANGRFVDRVGREIREAGLGGDEKCR